uniref:Uncharacterized protein n=2 Tax=Anopheles atroparvus TaxID=41427 RepID=A0A182JCK0_ANOAO
MDEKWKTTYISLRQTPILSRTGGKTVRNPLHGRSLRLSKSPLGGASPEVDEGFASREAVRCLQASGSGRGKRENSFRLTLSTSSDRGGCAFAQARCYCLICAQPAKLTNELFHSGNVTKLPKVFHRQCTIMRLLLGVITMLSLLAGIGAIFQGGVLDLNFFRCMWKKNYDCPHEDIRFFLYTPTFRKGKVIDMNKPKTIYKAGFKTNQQTAIIIHGFNGTQTSRHIMFLKDAYLSRKFNVFAVDWEVLSQYPCYLSSLSNTKLVSQCTAQLYSFLTFAGCTSKQITCVGHSLGAHICGMMTNHLTKKQYRIIGLDPARPLIEKHASKQFRLTRDDAKSVQIIHTNAGLLGQSAFTGKVDFCINGGQVQPYCEGDRIKQARCSHFLSVCYLANAILARRPMRAFRCPTGCVPDNRIPFVKSNRVRMKWLAVGQDTPGKYGTSDR